jgi:hypothetical protein
MLTLDNTRQPEVAFSFVYGATPTHVCGWVAPTVIDARKPHLVVVLLDGLEVGGVEWHCKDRQALVAHVLVAAVVGESTEKRIHSAAISA